MSESKRLVTKELFWKASHPGWQMFAQIFGYTRVGTDTLCGICQEGDPMPGAEPTGTLVIRSEDNGRSWVEAETFKVITTDPSRGVKSEQISASFLDVQKDVTLFFYSRQFVRDAKFFGGGAMDRKRNIRQYYRISRDGGKTWEPEQALIQKGQDFDETHWTKGVSYGRNGGKALTYPIQISNGNILLPFVMWPYDEETQELDLHNHMLSGVLIGTWQEDCSGLDWDVGEYVRPKTADPEQNNLVEITVAELNNGSILGVMRSFSATLPVKYYSVSKDGGLSWSDAAPLLFDDGEPLFSPASISRLIRSTRNGKLYWIGNIMGSKDELYADDSSRPRHRLLLTEVDEDTLAIKRDTVSVIDQQKKGDVEREYTNFGVYEDRETGDFILTMCDRCFPMTGPGVTETNKTSDTYRYRIEL